MTSLVLLPDRIEDGTGDDPAGRLLASLQLKRAVRSDCFIAAASGGEGFRMFGGHLIAQAIVAAGQTVTSGRVHAVQATFLRAGDRAEATALQVQRLFDGRSYRVRQVTIEQVGEMLMSAVISLHDGDTDSAGDDAHRTMPSLPAGPPGGLSPWLDQGGNAGACPIELRHEGQEGATHPASERTADRPASERSAEERMGGGESGSRREPGSPRAGWTSCCIQRWSPTRRT